MLTNLSNSVAINTSVLCDSLIWISKYLNQDQTITAQVAESGQLHAVILIVYTQNRQIQTVHGNNLNPSLGFHGLEMLRLLQLNYDPTPRT